MAFETLQGIWGVFKKNDFEKRLDKIDTDDPQREPIIDRGVPLHSVSRLLLEQEEVVSKLKLLSHVSNRVFDDLYLEVIKRYCEYVHQLPASENHHHARVGGLLRHGLEVAAGAYRRSNATLFAIDVGVEQRRVIEPAYQYASFLAGLLHDVGKAAYDLDIANKDHSIVWDPFVEPLYNWAVRHKVDRYYIHYVRGRAHKKHELISSIVISQILPKKS